MISRVHSLRVGKPLIQQSSFGQWTTALLKVEKGGEVWAGTHNLFGDEQADLKHHGGVDKAICVYPFVHYDYWNKRLGGHWKPGDFGENLTLEGLDDENRVILGDAPAGPIAVPMNGATYMADLTGGQKTGIFYDQRPNHAFAANLSKGKRVLDVFAHVGGFGLAGLAGGAASALAVDGSAPALALAEEGAAAMGVSDRFSTRQGDAFDILTALRAEGAEFDVVVCDPPAFAPNKPALEAGLRAYERIARLAAPLVAENGILGLCSCPRAADLTQFRTASVRGIGRAGRRAAMIYTGFAGPDHPQHLHLPESGYLKALVFRL